MSKKIKSLGKLFDRRRKVFGVHVFGTSEVKKYKFDHAANVLRDYLDSDGDGKADSKKLVKSLKREKAVLTVFSDDDQLENFLDKHERKFEKAKANSCKSFIPSSSESKYPSSATRGLSVHF